MMGIDSDGDPAMFRNQIIVNEDMYISMMTRDDFDHKIAWNYYIVGNQEMIRRHKERQRNS